MYRLWRRQGKIVHLNSDRQPDDYCTLLLLFVAYVIMYCSVPATAGLGAVYHNKSMVQSDGSGGTILHVNALVCLSSSQLYFSQQQQQTLKKSTYTSYFVQGDTAAGAVESQQQQQKQ